MPLDAAIEDLYSAFSAYRKPASIPACPCCLDAKQVCKLLNTSLRQIGPEDLSDYASSVLLTVGDDADFRYLFPRILELSIRSQFLWPDVEVVLGKLALADWKTWPEREQQAVMMVLAAAFESAIDPSSADADTLDSLLCGISLAGADVAPFLAKLEQPAQSEVLFDYFESNSTSLQKGRLNNAFWGEHREAGQPVIDWLLSEPVQLIIGKMQQQKYG